MDLPCCRLLHTRQCQAPHLSLCFFVSLAPRWCSGLISARCSSVRVLCCRLSNTCRVSQGSSSVRMSVQGVQHLLGARAAAALGMSVHMQAGLAGDAVWVVAC